MSNIPRNFSYYVIVLSTLTFVNAHRFSALSDSGWYIRELYLTEWNQEEASAPDPATADASTRLKICKDISHSGIFTSYGMEPVDTDAVYKELQQPKYSDIFHRIYSPLESSNSRNSHIYTNPYRLEEFQITPADNLVIRVKEYVFVCLLRKVRQVYPSWSDSDSGNGNSHNHAEQNNQVKVGESSSRNGENFYKEELDDIINSIVRRIGDIIPFYVTKAYGANSGIHVHRFLHVDSNKFNEEELMLAELSAEVYVRPDFNIELHYLELRKHHEPASPFTNDPVLKSYYYNRWSVKILRICSIVATSTYFQAKFGQVVRTHYNGLRKATISFQSMKGKQEAEGKFYQELVMKCFAHTTDKRTTEFYFSRAYNPFQVFVYLGDQPAGPIRLEMLAVGVSMAQDRHYFGDVEI